MAHRTVSSPGMKSFTPSPPGLTKARRVGVLEEVVPELFRLLERGEMVDIDHYQPRGGDESVALTTGKNAVGRYERQLSLFELAVFRYPAFPDEGA